MRASFPDSQRVYERRFAVRPSRSLFEFVPALSRPGLSDNAAFNLPKMPVNAYLGMYIDGEGPSGIIRDLPAGRDRSISVTCR